MYDIITIGSATRDVFLTSRAMHPHRASDAIAHIEACFPFGAKIGIDEIHFDTGGGATNNAATFAKIGKFRTAALGRIGNDSEGHEILRVLKARGVSTELMQTDPRVHTAYSTILSPGGEVGERTILVYRGASERFEHGKIPWRKMRARWFYISSLGGDLTLLKKILVHAKKVGAQVAWNPGGEELRKLKTRGSASGGPEAEPPDIQSINFLILNREEAAKLTGAPFDNLKEILRQLARLTLSSAEGKLGVVTDGPKGAYAVVGIEHRAKGKESKLYALSSKPYAAYYVPSVGNPAKNLTGAGDAFGSGFVTGWIKSQGDIKYALRLASFNADSVVQHIGAKNGILEKIPSKRQLVRLPVRELKI